MRLDEDEPPAGEARLIRGEREASAALRTYCEDHPTNGRGTHKAKAQIVCRTAQTMAQTSYVRMSACMMAGQASWQAPPRAHRGHGGLCCRLGQCTLPDPNVAARAQRSAPVLELVQRPPCGSAAVLGAVGAEVSAGAVADAHPGPEPADERTPDGRVPLHRGRSS